jgi:hypothetical protein
LKRDLELIRKMVLAIEDSPSGFAPDLNFDGYSDAQVGYHAYLLVDAGLARGSDTTTMGSDGPSALISSLTWEGHEFAEAARGTTRDGRRRLVSSSRRGGSVTLDVMRQLLISIMRGSLGLP